MQDLLDQIVGYLKGIWNKRWYAMFIAWVICLIGWAIIYQLPDKYEAKAKIYIDTQSLLRPLLKGLAVESDTKHELNLMVRTLLTRPNIEKIIRLSDLDLSVTNEKEFDGLVEDLQKDIKFKKASRTRVNLFDLSYTNTEPEIAQRVLQSVITVFVENSIGQNKDDTNSARVFILKQIKEYEKRLVESENRLKLFKQKNMGALPSFSSGNYYDKMENAKQALKATKLSVSEIGKGKKALQSEIRKVIEQNQRALAANNSALIKTSFDLRIEKLTSSLDELLLKYTDNHPDVKSTQRVLADLESKRMVELKMLRESASGSTNSLDRNPIYQELKMNLGQMESQEAILNVRMVEFKKRYEELAKMVDHIPEVEAQLTALNRDYGITRKKYEELLARKESATLSESITKSSDGVQFNVVDPPRVGNTPIGPKRLLLSSVILFVGLVGGIGFAFLLSQIKSVVNSGREFEQLFGLPILGTVSAVISPGQKKRRALLVTSYLSLAGLLFFVYAIVMVLYLDGIKEKIVALIF